VLKYIKQTKLKYGTENGRLFNLTSILLCLHWYRKTEIAEMIYKRVDPRQDPHATYEQQVLRKVAFTLALLTRVDTIWPHSSYWLQ
jgi:hypothetical protein